MIGIVMLAIGIAILSLGMSGGQLVVIPTGMLIGGLVELARGVAGMPTKTA